MFYVVFYAFLLVSFTLPSICSVVYDFPHISSLCFNCVKAPALLVNIHKVHAVGCSCWLLDLFNSFSPRYFPIACVFQNFLNLEHWWPQSLVTLLLVDTRSLVFTICSLAAGMGLPAWSLLATSFITGHHFSCEIWLTPTVCAMFSHLSLFFWKSPWWNLDFQCHSLSMGIACLESVPDPLLSMWSPLVYFGLQDFTA